MLLMGLALAGRAAVDLVDASRLQAWLAIPVQGEGADEAAGRADQLMKLWHQCTTCQPPTVTLAAAAQRMLVRARCLRSASADSVVEVYCASNEASATPGVWKAVNMVDARDQARWHNLLDSCGYQALECMMSELSKAWHSGLQRLDVLRPGLDEYVQMYMNRWDLAEMSEAERAQVRPSMASAIQGITGQPPTAALV